ncbi:hypothetical protein BASA81_002429 [Batrachochytrium salamandrivorans]|nr:hypothetical protein BASA81_002429 [Batrachochytrium salamandrivorans]
MDNPTEPQLQEAVVMETLIHSRNGGHSDLYITLASYGLILWLFCAQFTIVWWKKAYPSQYHAWSLAGLWIIPSSIGIYNQNWRFILFCVLFTMQAAYVFYLARRRPMNADDPQFIYRLFLVGHRITLGLASFGGFLFVLTLFALQPLFKQPFTWLVVDAVLFIFYGGYFGVLQRDFSQVVNDYLSKVVTSQIVVTSRSPGTKITIMSDSCGLCGRELRDSLADAESSSTASQTTRKTVKLKECSHEFHDECIRGWTVLGKRGVCPTCNEKADLSFLTLSSPWAKGSESWSEFLDLLRMLLVWNPIIFMVAMGMFYLTGLGESSH